MPSHLDCPAQFDVQPVPHVESHVFFDWQSYVTLLGGAAPPSPPSAEAEPPAEPNVQVPPVLQVHVLPEHWQSPATALAHDAVDGTGASFEPPHPVVEPDPAAKATAPTEAKTRAMARRAIMRRAYLILDATSDVAPRRWSERLPSAS